jgi:hypothetical protein
VQRAANSLQWVPRDGRLKFGLVFQQLSTRLCYAAILVMHPWTECRSPQGGGCTGEAACSTARGTRHLRDRSSRKETLKRSYHLSSTNLALGTDIRHLELGCSFFQGHACGHWLARSSRTASAAQTCDAQARSASIKDITVDILGNHDIDQGNNKKLLNKSCFDTEVLASSSSNACTWTVDIVVVHHGSRTL